MSTPAPMFGTCAPVAPGRVGRAEAMPPLTRGGTFRWHGGHPRRTWTHVQQCRERVYPGAGFMGAKMHVKGTPSPVLLVFERVPLGPFWVPIGKSREKQAREEYTGNRHPGI